MNIPRTRSALRRRPLLLAVTTLALLAPLTACGGSDAAEGDGKTLRLWHYEQEDGALSKAWDAAIAEFKTTHPDVKVVFERKTFEQIQQNAGMILNSDKAPDVMEYNKGNATTGQLAKQGLLTDLTPLVKEHGWDRKISESASVTARYNDKGEMGGDTCTAYPTTVSSSSPTTTTTCSRSTVSTSPPTSQASRPRWRSSRPRHHPARQRRQRPPPRPLALPARPVRGEQHLGRQLPALPGQGRIPRPRDDLRRRQVPGVARQGLLRQEDVGLKGSDMVEQFVSQKR
ncbi:extracellular solute-binding protein, partial [Streptomyces parvulus]|nr:extracellular solute-binding protein [Streptomyces parvulus]